MPTATGHGGESQNSNCLPLAMRRYSTLCIRPQAGVFRASHPRSFFTCPSRRHNFICDNSHRSTMTLAFVQIPIVKINCENVQRPLNLKHMKPGLWWIKKKKIMLIQAWWLLCLLLVSVLWCHWCMESSYVGGFTPTRLLQRDVAPDINYVIKFSHTADRNIIRSKRSLLLLYTLGCPACLLVWERVRV